MLGLVLRGHLGRRVAIGIAVDRAASSGPAIEVVDWTARAGPSLALAAAGPLELRAALEAGAALHRYRVTTAAEADAGHRLDLVAAAALALRIGLAERWALEVHAVATAANRSREHAAGGAILWRSPALRADGAILLGASL
jgi:hypothetical protein